jgi:hypothetical protein
MKYLTPELYTRLQDSGTAAMDAADAAWETAEERYEQHLQRLTPALAPILRLFDGLLLHDATVSSMSRRGDQLVIVLHTDTRPREVVTLTYTLAGEPIVDREALPPEVRSAVMQYQYDEFDLAQTDSGTEYLHAILFSNGWEVRVRFRHVEVERAEPLYLLPARADRERVA